MNKVKNILKLAHDFLNKFNNIKLFRDELTNDEIEAICNILNKFQYKDKIYLKQDMKLVNLNCWLGIIPLILNEYRGEFNGEIYAIDTFRRKDEYSKYLNIKEIITDTIKDIGALQAIKIIDRNLIDSSFLFKDKSIDVLFCNINNYEELKKILDIWYSKIRDNGLILGRFCETLDLDGIFKINIEEKIPFDLHLGVIKAIKQKFSSINLTEKGNIWYVYKTCIDECLQSSEVE